MHCIHTSYVAMLTVFVHRHWGGGGCVCGVQTHDCSYIDTGGGCGVQTHDCSYIDTGGGGGGCKHRLAISMSGSTFV